MIIVTHKRLSDTVALGPDNFQGVCFEAEPMQLAGEGQARQIQTVIVVGCKRKYRHGGRAREQEVEIDVFAAKGTSSSLGQERLVEGECVGKVLRDVGGARQTGERG